LILETLIGGERLFSRTVGFPRSSFSSATFRSF
jgi:hypothetical protein